MGQYYKIVNISKQEWLDPSVFNEHGAGRKFMEFAPSSEGVMLALALLLNENNGLGGGDFPSESSLIGRWARDSISIVGDYGEDEEDLYPANSMYGLSDEEDTAWENISLPLLALIKGEEDE